MQKQRILGDSADPRDGKLGFRSKNPALQRNMDECPNLQRVVDLLQKPGGQLGTIPMLDDALDQFKNSNELFVVIRQEFKDVMFEMQPPPPGNSLILYQDDHYTFSCDTYDVSIKRKLLTTTPFNAKLRVLRSDGEVEFVRYRLPDGNDMSILNPHAKLELTEQRILSSKDPNLEFNSDDVITLSGRGDMVMLALREHITNPFTWAFEPSNLAPLFITVSDQSYNRWKMLIELVVRFHGTEFESIYSSDLLMRLGDHELHYIRWSACQALSKIDLATAKHLIFRLTEDPHSHVRRAASAAMQRIRALELAA